MINCKIDLSFDYHIIMVYDLSFTKDCVLTENIIKTQQKQINNTKLYVVVVSLSINNNIKFLENVKQGFKITISWKKYRSEIT